MNRQLSTAEIEDFVTLRDVMTVVQRLEMVRRISLEIDADVVELALRLGERGHRVELIVSYRPAETEKAKVATGRRPATGLPALAAVNRVARPAFELAASAGKILSRSQGDGLAAHLLELLPARNMIWSFRLRQYIARLERSWNRAKALPGVVIFDQGFVQAISSLVLLGRAPSEALAARALDAAPRADLLVRLDAPRDVLQARLSDRTRSQGRLEQMLEMDIPTNLRSIDIIDDLQNMLACNGQPIAVARCIDHASLAVSLSAVVAQIDTMTHPHAQACAG